MRILSGDVQRLCIIHSAPADSAICQARRAAGRVARAPRLTVPGVFLIALGFATQVAQAAPAAFPAVVELSKLLPANGGNGNNGFVLNVNDGNGRHVSSTGDINGDGVDDLLIAGGDGVDSDRAGQSYVVFGRSAQTAGVPAEFDLSSLLEANGGDGSAGVVLHDAGGWDISGSPAGDVNGDGVEDLLIGAIASRSRERDTTGYVVFGRREGFPAELELSGLLRANGGDGSAGFLLAGGDAGAPVRSAGDVNGDGIGDLAGAMAGGAFVLFGRDAQSGFPAEFDLSTLSSNSGDYGFVLNGLENHDEAVAVAAAGDVNGDGIDDLLIGVSGADQDGPDAASLGFVVFGREGEREFPAQLELSRLLAANRDENSTGFALQGVDGDVGVSGAGDVNGDGVDDFLIGDTAGNAYVVFGRDETAAGFPPVLALSSLSTAQGGNGSGGFVLRDLENPTQAAAAGDVNGDGIDDLLLGGDETGQGLVLFGRDGVETGFPAEVGSSELPGSGDGTEGLVLQGLDGESSMTLAPAGDVNGDGLDDLLVGAGPADPEASGEFYVVLGKGKVAADPYPHSSYISSADFFWNTHRLAARGSDNHPATWGGDGRQYVVWGDGKGFENASPKRSLGVTALSGQVDTVNWDDVYYGSPNSKRPKNIDDSQVNGLIDGKSYGIISIRGTLYMWVSPGSGNDAYVSQQLYSSTDQGQTWGRATWDFPSSDKLVNLTFAQFGQNYLGAKDSYVYMYAVSVKDTRRNRIHKPGEIMLLRAPKDQLLVKSAYQYFAGMNGTAPIWSASPSAKKPVFQDANGVGSTVSAAYVAGLDRFVLMTEHLSSHDGRIGIFEAEQPWGAWKTVLYTKQTGPGDDAFFWNLSSKWSDTSGWNFVLIFSGADSYNSVSGTFVPSGT